MICLEALKSLSTAQTITTLSYSHLFFLSYHKGHNWTREKGTFTLPFRWFKYHQKQHSDYKYNMFGNNCFSIFEKNRNFIHIREMKQTFFLCCEQNVAVRHWEWAWNTEHCVRSSGFTRSPAPGHALLWQIFWMNESPAASLLQKWGKYFLIFHAAVQFSKHFYPSVTKWWKCVRKHCPLECSGRNVFF